MTSAVLWWIVLVDVSYLRGLVCGMMLCLWLGGFVEWSVGGCGINFRC